VSATKKAVHVILAFNRPDDWEERLSEHPVVRRPLDALRRDLTLELRGRKLTVELLPTSTVRTASTFVALFSRRTGERGSRSRPRSTWRSTSSASRSAARSPRSRHPSRGPSFARARPFCSG
jgi:hypothetical protein